MDADHIAAIDNVTRKLMGEGRPPLWTGFFFALASVVVAMVIGGIEALGLLADRFGLGGTVWRAIGGLNGHFTALGVSAVVLFAACWGVALFGRRADEAV